MVLVGVSLKDSACGASGCVPEGVVLVVLVGVSLKDSACGASECVPEGVVLVVLVGVSPVPVSLVGLLLYVFKWY